MRVGSSPPLLARGAALLAALLLSGVPVGATADGRRDLDDGIAFYENLDNERARERLERAADAKELAAPERARALLYLGLVHFEGGARADADAAWRRAFELDPAVVVPEGTSPKAISAIEAARPARGASKSKEPPPATRPGGPKDSDPALAPAGTGEEGKTTRATEPTRQGVGPSDGPPKLAPSGAPTDPALPPSPALVVDAHGPNEEEESSLGTWLIIGGIGAALAGAAVVTVLLVGAGGECREGGCLTVSFE